MYNYLDMCLGLEKVTIHQCGSHTCGTEALRCLPKLQFLEIHVQYEAVHNLTDEDEEVDTLFFCFPKHIKTLVLQVHITVPDLRNLFDSLTVLSSLARLHLCSCYNCYGDVEASLALRHLRSLESLHLRGFCFAPAWASDSSCLTRLTLLSFASMEEAVHLRELAALPALQTLHLRAHVDGCDYVGWDLDLNVLPELPPTLRELRVTRLTWAWEMRSLRGLANLRVCMLHGTGTVSLPGHMPHLQTLVLDRNDGLVLEDHLTGFTALRLLSLRDCGQVAVPGAFNQLAALPHLTCIDVAGSLPGNQLDWSAYAGLPLRGGVPGSLSNYNSSDRLYLVYEGMITYDAP